MIRRLCLLGACWTISLSVHAQYFQYSQYNLATQRINPAMTGLTRYATAGTLYRRQQTAGDFAIHSNFVSFSYPLLNSSTGVPWSGIALSLHNDQSTGIFKTQEAALAYAIHVRTGRHSSFSFGAKALYQTRRIGLDGYYTGSQYVPDRGFDPGQSSGESFPDLRSSFKTFSTGLYWQEVDKKGRLLHHVGASLFDLNKPGDSFFGSTSNLSSTFVVNGGFQSYSSGGFHLFPEGLLTWSGNTAMFNGGLRFQKELNVAPKRPSDLVDVILKYAVGRSGIAGIQLHRENLSVGLSYDFPLFRKNPGNWGALEFGLELRKLVSTRAQKAVAKRKKAAAEKQALARKQEKKDAKPKVEPTVPAPVVVTETDTASQIAPVTIVETRQEPAAAMDGTARVGKIKQDPLVVERVTLHFAFEFNSSDLDEPTEEFLEELANTMKQDENLQLKIVGHTDNIGSDKFNLRLSHKRADVVKAVLIKKGVSPERLTTEGKGMREPLNNNETDQDRAKNRRVEITVFY